MLVKLVQVRLANDRAAFERPMILRAGEAVGCAGGRDLRANGDVRGLRREQRIEIESRFAAVEVRDATAAITTEAERKSERVISLSGNNPDAAAHLATAEFDLDDLRILEAEFRRSLAADEDRVVPAHLRHRVRQLHEPRVIRPTSVVELVVAGENDFELLFARRVRACACECRSESRGIELNRKIQLTSRAKTIVQILFPRLFVTAECLPRDLVTARLDTCEISEHFDFAESAEERLNQRLHGNHCAVQRSSIAPSLQIVCCRDVNVADWKCFILVVAESHHRLCLALRDGPIQIGGRGENWIAT